MRERSPSAFSSDLLRQAPVAKESSPRQNLLFFAIIAFAIKLLFLVLDPNPEFFLDDSGSYLYTALTHWIPLDRSFLYGYLIRWLSVRSGSLFSLVLVQALTNAILAVLLGWLLMRFMRVSLKVTIIALIFYCIDPLQLMYERFVMTETFSLAGALLFVCFLSLFVENGRTQWLVFASIAGIVTVALRISFLPLVTALSFGVPLVRFFL